MKNRHVTSYTDFKGVETETSTKKQVQQKTENVAPVFEGESMPIYKEAVKEEKVIETKELPILPNQIVEEVIEKEAIKEEVIIETIPEEIPLVEEDESYKLYKDINEEFSCDIEIEGASPENSFSRIIIETKEWSLVFDGTILNGKCNVPIKKLGILKEGDTGTIKLEVVAEGNLFVPWSDTFRVKLSKKVTVNLDEKKTAEVKPNGISVSISR
jgi:hypothetical protein